MEKLPHAACAAAIIALALVAGALVAAEPGATGSAKAVQGTADDIFDLVYLAPKQPIFIRFHIRVDGQPLSEFRKAVAERVFESLDTDKNGVLEGKELEQIPTAEMLAAASGQLASPPNSDAKPNPSTAHRPLKLNDLSPYVLANAGSPFALTIEGNNSDNQVIFFANGFAQTASLDMTPLLAVIDLNGDGLLTAADFARVDELFKILDVNDDETISRTEIAAAKNYEGTSSASSGPLTGMATLLQPIDRWGSRTSLVRKLVQLYDRTTRDPKTRRASRDKKLSAAELGLPAEELARFDKNRDGVLDVHEAEEWLASPNPQFEIDVEMKRKSLQKPTVAVRRGSSQASDTGLAVRSGSEGEAVLQIGRLPIELRAAETRARSNSRQGAYKQQFKRADRDNNDYLDENEIRFTQAGVTEAEFRAMDRDHNGMVFEGEWIAYMTLRDTLVDNRITLAVTATSTDPITQFDTNNDGRLSHREFVQALATIQTWDVDHDQRISPDEIPRHFYGTFRIGTAAPRNGARGGGAMMYTNGSAPVVAKDAPAWFQKMDRNRDGEVSFREFLGPLSTFHKLDANHDGFLDVREALTLTK